MQADIKISNENMPKFVKSITKREPEMRQALSREVLRMLHMPKERGHQLAPWYTADKILLYIYINRNYGPPGKYLFK